MPNSKNKNKKQTTSSLDVATENYSKGYWALSRHPMFSPLRWHVHLVRREGNLCPKDGWAVVTSNGQVHVHPTRRGEPEEWTYVLAHCLLHLGFEHFEVPAHKPNWRAGN